MLRKFAYYTFPHKRPVSEKFWKNSFTCMSIELISKTTIQVINTNQTNPHTIYTHNVTNNLVGILQRIKTYLNQI